MHFFYLQRCGCELPEQEAGEFAHKVCHAEMAKMYTNSVQQQKEMPAYLEELKYELDWMMKMQREDGALYHKVGCYQFCSFIMPEDEKDELVISPVSVTATADFAAVTAMAVRFYKRNCACKIVSRYDRKLFYE